MGTLTSSRIKKMSPQLLVADLERSLEFYTKQLGFDVEFRYEDFYAGIIKDGYSIHLKLGEHSAMAQLGGPSEEEDLDIVFSVEGLEDLYEEMVSKGVEIVQPLREMPYGREFYITDPDGHIFAFMAEA